jgi:type II secretory pathway component PulK
MRRRGLVLLAVLVVAALVAVIALGLMFRLRAETGAAAATERGEQAWYAAMSGVSRAAMILKTSRADPKTWYDNPDALMNQMVVDDGRNRWYFTVWAEEITPDGSQPNTVRYGVTDEAGKINLNTAEADVLAALPNMESMLVDCLLDYRDEDSDARPQGAEQDYYDALEHPYRVANGPLTTLDEVLLVKGFTARILYGEDANRNGLLDPNEADGDESFPPDSGDETLDRGLYGVATVVSSEPNVDSSGRTRVNINTGTLSTSLGLSQKTLDFIRIYKAEGSTFKHPSELLEMQYTLKENQSTTDGDRFAGDSIDSGVGANELPAVLDRLTAVTSSSGQTVKGLVNVNTAPVEVLSTLPGLGGSAAQQIVETRRGLDIQTQITPAWLYTQAGLSAAEFKAVAPLLTARSYQYSIRCIGFGVPCGRFRIVEAVIDLSPQGGSSTSTSTTGSAQAVTPRIIYLRDLTRLGLPFPLDPDTIEHSQQM